VVATVLEIRGDSSSLVRASKEADRALDSTARKADVLSTKAKATGNNLSAAFAATGGGIAVTRGLAGIGSGFRSANSGMALFSASQALLDFGRLSSDMSAVAGATGAAGGAFSKLGAIIKANPVLAIAGLIATAATAMELFGKETEKTATAFEKLDEAQRKSRLSQENREYLGISTTSERQRQLGGIESLSGLIGSGGQKGRLTASTIAEFTNVNLAEIIAAATSLRSKDPALKDRVEGSFFNQGLGYIPQGDLGGGTQISPQATRRIIRLIYQDMSRELSGGGAGGGGVGGGAQPYYGAPYGPVDPRGPLVSGVAQPYYGAPYGPTYPGENYGPTFGFQQSREANRNLADDRAFAESEAAMDQLIRQGEQFGASLTDAFYGAATGAKTLQQAVAQIVSQLARAGLNRALVGLGGAVAGSFGTPATGVGGSTRVASTNVGQG
jgi:hypothetical protein